MNSIRIKQIESIDMIAWDAYVRAHPKANLYHLSNWKNVIEKTYGHKTYYLIATKNSANPNNPNNPIVGILPLVHLKHFVFGNNLISIPFFDMGGILADDKETEKALLHKAVLLGQKLNVGHIELRHTEPLSIINEFNSMNTTPQSKPIITATKSHKVRMQLNLAESSEILMKSFKAKLRSQIKKPLKEGLRPKVGGLELLDDFYEVFSINMRDLGSPVHSKKIVHTTLEELPDKTNIIMVYKDDIPLACSVIVGFKDTMQNPWASALREYSRLAPNMLLYWTMLEYACDNGYAFFDFGRSSPDEGTYRFKKQWGAKQTPLHWHYIFLNEDPAGVEASEKSKFSKAIQYWQKLPVSITKVMGPMIRKYIGL